MERALTLLESGSSNGKRMIGFDRSDLLVEILMLEKRFEAAWAAVRKFSVSVYAKEELARASDSKFPREALEFYAGKVESLANASAYDEATKLIARMAKLRSKTEQADYLADLKTRHGRKRKFMSLLG
jgi:negative regulator of replication initiation